MNLGTLMQRQPERSWEPRLCKLDGDRDQTGLSFGMDKRNCTEFLDPAPSALDEDKAGFLPHGTDRDETPGTSGQSFISTPNKSYHYTSSPPAWIPRYAFLVASWKELIVFIGNIVRLLIMTINCDPKHIILKMGKL